MNQLQPAWRGARTPQARVVHLLPRKHVRLARSRAGTLKRRMLVGGRGWYVGARPCSDREGDLAGAVGYHKYRPNPTSAARSARTASAGGAPPPERERIRWRVCMCAHSNAGCSLEAAACTWEHGRASREWAIALAQWISIGHEPIPTSAAQRAHAVSARGARSPERERTVVRSRARTLKRRLLLGGRT